MSLNHNCSQAFNSLLHRLVYAMSDTSIPKQLEPKVESPVTVTDSMANASNSTGMNPDYDYRGALLFVVGLLCMYGLCILLLIISLIRKSRTELELVDHLRDFEAMRRASQKKGIRAFMQGINEEFEEDNHEFQKLGGYKSIRPDHDDEYSDIMSVSRAKRKARRASFADSRVSSQDTASSVQSLDDTAPPLVPQILCMYCAKKLAASGECTNCEHTKSTKKPSETVKDNNTVSRPESHKDKFETENELCKIKDLPLRPRLAMYHSVDSAHDPFFDTVEEEDIFISKTSHRRKSSESIKLTKQSGLDCPDDDADLDLHSSRKASSRVKFCTPDHPEFAHDANTVESQKLQETASKRQLEVNSATFRTGPLGLQAYSRWLALKALYMEKGALCSAAVEEEAGEDDDDEPDEDIRQ